MPANSKAIRKRIKSVASTKKITRTMEMVATSKLQRTQGRVIQSRPYVEAMSGLMQKLSASAASARLLSPLFERRSPMKRVLVYVITANRGLCGGFNTNIVRKARDHIDGLENEGLEVTLAVAGKKGIAQLRFQGYRIDQSRTDLSDNPGFHDAASLAAPVREAFLLRDVDLATEPGEPPPEEDVGAYVFIYEPSAQPILEELGPAYVKNLMYRILLSSVASEQLARRVAMKNATDNAGEMERSLTRDYNKARQAAITQEIAEIVGGVEALK